LTWSQITPSLQWVGLGTNTSAVCVGHSPWVPHSMSVHSIPGTTVKGIIPWLLFAVLGLLLAGTTASHADDHSRFPGKRVPELATFSALFGPNYSHAYLKHADQFPFRPTAQQFERVNAWWLAELSMLAYADGDGFIKRQLKAAGIHHVKRYASPEGSLHDTQVIVAHDAHTILVAFRGTEPDQWKDFLTDLNAHQTASTSGGKVHSGFSSALQSVWNQMKPELDRLSSEGRHVWFTGHSMGAALAVLAAHQFGKRAGVYTFGSPRIGDAEFSRKYAQPTYRVVNNTDFVTEVPPPLLYHHIGDLMYFDSDHHLTSGIAVSGLIKDRARSQATAMMDRISQWAKLDLDTKPVKTVRDHAPVLYAIHCWNELIRQHRTNENRTNGQ